MKRIILPALLLVASLCFMRASASSHREAPLISNDPLADNTDLYVFRDPTDLNKLNIIACYVPMQLPQGGPNYYNFGSNIRYEIHIDNDLSTTGDDIIYRFTFWQINEDPTTFFNIRLGKQNLKTMYKLERSLNGGRTFTAILDNAVVPPPNIGPRSIKDPVVGLGANDYRDLIKTYTASNGDRVYAGPADDPFFVDLGGIFDLGDAPRTDGTKAYDGLKCKNVSVLALKIDIDHLQKDRKKVSEALNILDPDYVIGVWASASRKSTRVLNGDGTETYSNKWIQVSRLGMPLTNEAVIPVGYKDLWNAITPYQDLAYLSTFGNYFYNPELALYMDDAQFGGAVPALTPLRIQKNSLGSFGFGNGQDGLYSLKGTPAVAGTALDDAIFGTLLLPAAASPRSVDLWPAFHTGVPNLSPYQLATGKNGDPLAAGKPFVNNFLPSGGDMLRINMAVPPTQRNSADFSSLGLVQACVLGLTDPRYNTNTNLEFIPNMDGFPNGRRLEDDVTRIELQAVAGVVLAAIGLPYDDYVSGGSLVTQDLLDVLTYSTGINENDTTFRTNFPFVQTPWAGTAACCGKPADNGSELKIGNSTPVSSANLSISAPQLVASVSPNPFVSSVNIKYHLANKAKVVLSVYDAQGRQVALLVNKTQEQGNYNSVWNSNNAPAGIYYVQTFINGENTQTLKVVKQ